MNTQVTDPFAPPGWETDSPAPPEAPQQPWWQRDGVISRLLVLAGVGVTLIGVVMLLVVAAQHGLLGPHVRVAGGGVLSAALIGAGWRVMDRPGGRIGGVALQATGFAGIFLEILAITTFYEWVPPLVGLVLAFGATVGGALCAMRWNAQSLAVLVIGSGALLAPFLTRELNSTLVAFLLVFAVVGAIPEILRGWEALALVRTTPVVVAAVAAFGLEPTMTSTTPSVIDFLTCLSILMVGLVSGLVSMRQHANPLPLIAMAITSLPAFGVGAMLETWPAVSWYALIAAILIAPVLLVRDLDRVHVVTLGVLSAFSMLICVALLTVSYQTALPLLGLSIVLCAIDLVRPSAATQIAGQAMLLVGGLYLMNDVPLGEFVRADLAAGLSAGAAVSAWVGVLAAAVAGVSAARSSAVVRDARPGFLVGDLMVGLYFMTAGFVAASVQALGVSAGFPLGQFLSTATAMVVAVALLAFGLRRPDHARVALTAGLGLVAAALAKLFLFDLASTGGLGRAAAFLVVGLLLLAAGTRYARTFAERGMKPAV
ncbi:DUF2339 domain-containing protein [Demetria terragena]|uniref:DUF2339 domain-containing protein n=1 Tax=Demetria terragena TaxID=63959 RepID=UPI00037E9660|nr:DUF2339 domain-containing protein [Demetria terragena]